MDNIKFYHGPPPAKQYSSPREDGDGVWDDIDIICPVQDHGDPESELPREYVVVEGDRRARGDACGTAEAASAVDAVDAAGTRGDPLIIDDATRGEEAYRTARVASDMQDDGTEDLSLSRPHAPCSAGSGVPPPSTGRESALNTGVLVEPMTLNRVSCAPTISADSLDISADQEGCPSAEAYTVLACVEGEAGSAPKCDDRGSEDEDDDAPVSARERASLAQRQRARLSSTSKADVESCHGSVRRKANWHSSSGLERMGGSSVPEQHFRGNTLELDSPPPTPHTGQRPATGDDYCSTATVIDDADAEWYVKKVSGLRRRKGCVECRVIWADTWEPIRNVDPLLVARYRKGARRSLKQKSIPEPPHEGSYLNPCEEANGYKESERSRSSWRGKLGPQTLMRQRGRRELRHATVPIPAQPSINPRKRKRANEDKDLSIPPKSKFDDKRKQGHRRRSDFIASSRPNGHQIESDPIRYWSQEGHWPKEYFKQDDETRKNFEKDSWIEENRHEKWFKRQHGSVSRMSDLLARLKRPASLQRRNSGSGNSATSDETSSDQKPREVKSTPYSRPSYATVLATKGSFLDESDLEITDTCKIACLGLLTGQQNLPQDSLFRDDVFRKACRKLQDKNEARIIQDITRLLVPSAETLATYGATHLDCLIESVNEGWNSAIPFHGTRPQPDYSIGFARSAFTNEQLEKLKPFVGEITDSYTSFFMATWQMYFPFFTCEVKCGAAALDIADRQNAHSMTIAVRGVVELFRYVKREKELHREILAFSISHDHTSVRIYGHYALVEGEKTTFYRHPIHKFDFTSLDGKEKWTAYKFTKNVYDTWMPAHLKRICSAVDDLPSDLNFDVSQKSELQFQDEPNSQPSQELATEASQQSDATSQSSFIDSQNVTPNTSITEKPERAFKKPKSKR